MRSYYYTLVAVLLTSVQQASGFAPGGRHASLHRRATVGMAVKGREIEQLAKLIPDKASVQALFTSSDDGFLNRETFGNALVAEPPLSVEAIDQIWKMAGGGPTPPPPPPPGTRISTWRWSRGLSLPITGEIITQGQN
mmetsp:Transcript_7026/g.16922  ORF Transcript_7026/g.16922 Transcript_7026/m.16922 type:complete len:138 (-) Transcript_7026:69-482(-)